MDGAGEKVLKKEPRDRLGLLLICIGVLGILWGVLFLNARALGGPPADRTFANRRPYNQVKRATHEAFPGFALRAGGGFVLLILGAFLRTKPRE